MKIGIIVHSFTGNTLLVAEKIAERLKEKGHSVNIEKVLVKGGEKQNETNFVLEKPPEVTVYDALVFGAPIRGFSLSPVMAAYLKQLKPLNGKKIACFVTKQLASHWTGGKNALSSMKGTCTSKGGDVIGTGTVFWGGKQRDKMIEDIAESFGNLF